MALAKGGPQAAQRMDGKKPIGEKIKDGFRAERAVAMRCPDELDQNADRLTRPAGMNADPRDIERERPPGEEMVVFNCPTQGVLPGSDFAFTAAVVEVVVDRKRLVHRAYLDGGVLCCTQQPVGVFEVAKVFGEGHLKA